MPDLIHYLRSDEAEGHVNKRNKRYVLPALLLASGVYCSQVLAGISVYPIEVSIANGGAASIKLMSHK